MQLKECKLVHESGGFTGCLITPSWGGDKGWFLFFTGKPPAFDVPFCSQRDPDNPKAFKTIEQAMKTAKDIGFANATLKFMDY